jgi:hypothetical protein
MVRNAVEPSTTTVVFTFTFATFGVITYGTAAISFIIGTSAGFGIDCAHYGSLLAGSAQFYDEMPDLFHSYVKLIFLPTYQQTRLADISRLMDLSLHGHHRGFSVPKNVRRK